MFQKNEDDDQNEFLLRVGVSNNNNEEQRFPCLKSKENIHLGLQIAYFVVVAI